MTPSERLNKLPADLLGRHPYPGPPAVTHALAAIRDAMLSGYRLEEPKEGHEVVVEKSGAW